MDIASEAVERKRLGHSVGTSETKVEIKDSMQGVWGARVVECPFLPSGHKNTAESWNLNSLFRFFNQISRKDHVHVYPVKSKVCCLRAACTGSLLISAKVYCNTNQTRQIQHEETSMPGQTNRGNSLFYKNDKRGSIHLNLGKCSFSNFYLSEDAGGAKHYNEGPGEFQLSLQ